jgi:hypothetical protein
MTAAGVALLETEELQLGLDLIHERLAHFCGVDWQVGDSVEEKVSPGICQGEQSGSLGDSQRVEGGRECGD